MTVEKLFEMEMRLLGCERPNIQINQYTATLELSMNKLNVLPMTSILKLNEKFAIEYLQLKGNNLSILPEELEQLTDLISLNLEYNNFTEFPPVILKLHELKEIFLDVNNINSFDANMI